MGSPVSLGVLFFLLVAIAVGAPARAVPPFGKAMLSEFNMDPTIINLNQGSYGVMAKDVLEGQIAMLRNVERSPEAWFRFQLESDGTEECEAEFQCQLTAARKAWAAYLGVNDKDIVFVPNASGGINAVIRSMAQLFQDKGKVKMMYLDTAYGMVKETLAFVAGQVAGAANGTLHEQLVSIDTTSLYPNFSDDGLLKLLEQALDDPKNKDTIAMACFSHITSIPGTILPIKRMVEACHKRGVLVLVDGAHVPGQIVLNVTDVGADFYVGNGHKWLYTGRGCAFLYTAPHLQRYIYPAVIDGTVLSL